MPASNQRCSLGIAFLAGLLGCGLARELPAQESRQGDSKADPQKADAPAFTFEMRGKPWGAVFEWLTDKTGTPFISKNHPTGTLNFIAKKGQKYTIPQIIDIINDGLLLQKYVLIKRASSFTVVPADEEIDPFLVPHIALHELNQHGKTEIVSTLLKLKSLLAEDTAPEVRKQMGPFGKVITLARMNQLILQDTVGNLERILDVIQAFQEGEADQAETYAQRCIYVCVRDAEAILRNTLGDQKQIIEMLQAPAPPGAGGQQLAARDRPVTKQRIRWHTVSADERTNTIFVNGPPDKIAQAKAVLAKLDVGDRPILVGGPVSRTYPAKSGNAEILAKNLAEVYKGAGNIRISAMSHHQILVWAQPEDQADIARQIEGIALPTNSLEVIPLNVLDRLRVADTLKAIFPDSKNLAPYIESDPSRNAILVKGTPEQVADVKASIRSIGENPASGNLRIFTMDRGSGATMADAVQRLMFQMRPESPVRVVPNGVASPASKP